MCPSCIVCDDKGASSGMHMHIRAGYAVAPIERAATFVNEFHWVGTEHLNVGKRGGMTTIVVPNVCVFNTGIAWH